MSGALLRAYEEHVDVVYGYLAYRHGSRAVAEELTQATFERALGEAALARDQRGPRLALLAIAREMRPDPASEATDGDAAGVPPDLAAALARVDRGERAVLALRFGANLPPGEIAVLLDLSERTVRQLLSRAIRRVRTELERERGADDEQREA